MTAVIRNPGKLPDAPYPKTPVYRRATIEVPKDAKVVKVKPEPLRTDWHLLTREERKALFNRAIVPPKRKKTARELTPTEVRRALALHRSGMRQKQIARELRCSQQSVSKAFQALVAEGRIPPPKNRKRILTPEEIRTVKEMYEAGASQNAIKNALRCDSRLIAKTINELVENGALKGKHVGRGVPRILTDDEIETVAEFKRKGMAQNAIARALHCDNHLIVETVHFLKEEGRL